MPTTTRRQFTATERTALQNEALRLRNLGHTYSEIAALLGLAGSSNASRAVGAALARQSGVGTRQSFDPMARYFGVEIECVGLTTRRAALALEAAGIACQDAGYTHAVMNTWKAVTDASVSGGCEIVSPKLMGEDGLRQLAIVMAALRGAGARIEPTCGMHVHVDMTGFTGAQVAEVVEAYADNADAIDMLVAPSRRNGGGRSSWCRRMDSYRKDAIVSAFKNGNGASVAASAHRNHDRYYNVNIASFHRYGTVEFRQHQGSLNGAKATAWVRFLLALATTAAEDGAWRSATTTDLLAKVGPKMSENARTYLIGRAVQFGAA